ncbi:glycosyltransferase [Paraglaciecola aestuariivivens]
MPQSVSIIIPTYNGREFIEETIQSCIKQSYQYIEIFVIDDGSTDGTRELLLAFKDKVTLVFNDKNLGIVKNINQAVDKINSDYFIFLGHDDLLAKDHIKIMVDEFEPDVVAVHCNSMQINERGEEIELYCDDKKQIAKTSQALFELSLNNFVSSCGLLCRTSVFKSVGGWDESYLHYGEWLYYVKALQHGKLKYTTKTYAFYRRHDTNITNTFTDKDVMLKLKSYYNACRTLAHKTHHNSISEWIRFYASKLKRAFKNEL